MSKLSDSNRTDLMIFLSVHESDIAHGINDFGGLKFVFISLFNRHPRKNVGEER